MLVVRTCGKFMAVLQSVGDPLYLVTLPPAGLLVTLKQGMYTLLTLPHGLGVDGQSAKIFFRAPL